MKMSILADLPQLRYIIVIAHQLKSCRFLLLQVHQISVINTNAKLNNAALKAVAA